MQTRICTKCGIEKEITEYKPHKANSDGIHRWCSECCKAYAKQYRENNKERINEQTKEWKRTHKERVSALNQKSRENNKDKVLLYNKLYREKNSKIIAEKNSIYYQNNKGKISVRNSKWKKLNLEKCNMQWQRRRNKKNELPDNMTQEQWEECLKYFDNKCAYCGEETKLHKEHFLALSKGGGYTIDNILPACARCNGSKNAKDFNEWYSKQKYYNANRKQRIIEYIKMKSA